MSGIPVVVVAKGGIPVRSVSSNQGMAPVLTVAANGRGMPVTLSDNGAPFILRGYNPWSPASLFGPSTPGFWAAGYNPSTMRVLTSIGGGPATYGEKVGAVIKAAGTLDATQATEANKPTLARWPKGGRRNLLVCTEDYSDDHWVKTGTVTTVIGEPTVVTLGNQSSFEQSFTLAAGVYSSRMNLKGPAGKRIGYSLGIPGSASIHTFTGGWDYIGLSNFSTSGSGRFYLSTWGLEGVTFELSQPQFEAGPPTEYQLVVSTYDITEYGVPSRWHIAKSGSESLNVVLPSGEYGVACVDPYGVITTTTVTSDGSTPINTVVTANQIDVVIRAGAFDSSEVAELTAYWSSI